MISGEKIRTYLDLAEAYSVSRRYFLIGFFDGLLAIAGFIVGAFISGHNDPKLVLSVGFATMLAIGISSAWGAFEAERIEQQFLKRKRERHMLSSFERSLIEDAHKFAILITSAVHGIAPVLGSIVLMAPYFFLPPLEAFEASMAIFCLSLFIVGVFMGRNVGGNVLINGLRTLLFGFFVMLLVIFLNPAHVI
uniref:VIT family protein n=1 Tax=Archaeoglobus fulgidus TaxID=2234 RepID=A0A7J2TID7_ARCFL